MRIRRRLLACLWLLLPAVAQPASDGLDGLAGPPGGSVAAAPVPWEFQRLVVRRRPDPLAYPPLARFASLEGRSSCG